MTIVYRTSGPWGGGAGANLSPVQVDHNFYDVDYRVQQLELHPTQPVQISYFTATGSQFYVYMSDGTVQGPLTLPVVTWNFRGDWATSVTYLVNDVVVGPDSAVYLVSFSHTSSAATFDPGASDGLGHDFYKVLLTQPAIVIPVGGGAGYSLTKTTAADYDMMWSPPVAPFGGNAGQVLQKNSSFDSDASWRTLALSAIGDVRVTTPVADDYLQWNAATSRWENRRPTARKVLSASSWDPVVGDDGAFMVLTNGTVSVSVTIPSDSTQAFPVGTELTIHQDGTGVVTIDGEPGVNLLKHVSFSNKLLGQYATATVKKTAANEWRLFGLLAA